MTRERYWATVHALRRIRWTGTEASLLRLVLDECYEKGREVWRISTKKELELFLAGQELKNFLPVIEELRGTGALRWHEQRDGQRRFEFFELEVMDPPWRTGERPVVDVVCYDRLQCQLIALNGEAGTPTPMLASQDGQAPVSPFEGSGSIQNDFRSELKNFAPTKGLAGTMPAARPYHGDRGDGPNVGLSQGGAASQAASIGPAQRADNAVQETEGAAPASGAVVSVCKESVDGQLSGVPLNFQAAPQGWAWREFVCCRCQAPAVKLWPERWSFSAEVELCRGCDPREAAREERVLKFSTGSTENQNRNGKVLKISTSSTENQYSRGEGGAIASIAIAERDLKGNCNRAIAIGEVSVLLRARDREEWFRAAGVVFAGLQQRQALPHEALWHSLRVLGAFERPDGGRQHRWWQDWLRRAPGLVQGALKEARNFRLRKGKWPMNMGAFLNHVVREMRSRFATEEARP